MGCHVMTRPCRYVPAVAPKPPPVENGDAEGAAEADPNGVAAAGAEGNAVAPKPPPLPKGEAAVLVGNEPKIKSKKTCINKTIMVSCR